MKNKKMNIFVVESMKTHKHPFGKKCHEITNYHKVPLTKVGHPNLTSHHFGQSSAQGKSHLVGYPSVEINGQASIDIII